MHKQVGRNIAIQGLWASISVHEIFYSMCGLFDLKDLVLMNCQKSNMLNL